MFWWTSCTSARHAGNFDCLMTSLILITMDSGRGHCAYWQSCKVPNQTQRGMKKIKKMYAIKQIKICAEYRDMLPRPRLDLSGTPGLRPIGLSPGSWQTSLGLGSMSQYSAQILIWITNIKSSPCDRKGNTNLNHINSVGRNYNLKKSSLDVLIKLSGGSNWSSWKYIINKQWNNNWQSQLKWNNSSKRFQRILMTFVLNNGSTIAKYISKVDRPLVADKFRHWLR